MNINKIVETCIYSSDLDDMKKFCVDIRGLPLLEEEKGKARFLACRQEHAIDIQSRQDQHRLRQAARAWCAYSAGMHPLCNGDWSSRIAALEEIVCQEQNHN